MLTMYRRISNSIVVFKANQYPNNMTVPDLFKNGLVEIKIIQVGNTDASIGRTSAADPKQTFTNYDSNPEKRK